MAANTLGGLIVRLGLDAAEFTSGLTKSERQAQQFARRLDQGIATAARGAALGLAAVGAAALATAVAIDRLAKEAGKFQDLAEITGTNAEALASFAVSASVAGSEMSTIADASVKLTKNLTGVDDESKAAGAALTALGLSIKEFKALDPATQMETVAKALAGFEEGAGKTAVAVALLGKTGAQLLPFLKELASEGGRQVILTQKQIELADDYADRQAKAAAQLRLYAQVIATEALPAVNALTKATIEFVKDLINVDTVSKRLRDDNPIAAFAESAALAVASVADKINLVVSGFRLAGIVIGATVAQLDAIQRFDFSAYKRIQDQARNDIAAIAGQASLVSRLEAEFAAQRNNAGLRAQEDRGFRPPGRVLNFAGPQQRAGGGAGAAERVSEAQRFLESLQKQIDKTLELTVVETARLEIQKGLKGITPEIERQILAVAGEIDAYNALKKAIEEGAKAFEEEKRAMEDAQRVRERNIESSLRESESIAQANEQLRDEIAIILGGETARAAIEKARVSSAIAIKEEALAQLQLNGASSLEIDILKNQIDLLRERAELMQGKSFAEQLAKDAALLQDFKNQFSDTFASAFSDFISGTKSAKEAFRAFADDITRQLNRLAAQKIGDALFGGNTSSGSLDIGKIIGLFFGAFSGGGGAGAGFGMNIRAHGGPVAANTPYMVGERGRELFVPQTSGAIVPNNKLGGGLTLVQHINVMPGASTQSAMQAANMAGQQACRAVVRNG